MFISVYHHLQDKIKHISGMEEEGGKMTSSVRESISKSRMIFRTACDGTRTIMKDSPLTVLGLNLKQTPKISEIVEQSKVSNISTIIMVFLL